MSEGIVRCPNRDYEDSGTDQTHQQELEESTKRSVPQKQQEPEHKSIEQQLIHAIGNDNQKKTQKAINPLTKNKENKTDNPPPPLGAKPTTSKIIKTGQRDSKATPPN
jgi:hypothetical protein